MTSIAYTHRSAAVWTQAQ